MKARDKNSAWTSHRGRARLPSRVVKAACAPARRRRCSRPGGRNATPERRRGTRTSLRGPTRTRTPRRNCRSGPAPRRARVAARGAGAEPQRLGRERERVGPPAVLGVRRGEQEDELDPVRRQPQGPHQVGAGAGRCAPSWLSSASLASMIQPSQLSGCAARARRASSGAPIVPSPIARRTLPPAPSPRSDRRPAPRRSRRGRSTSSSLLPRRDDALEQQSAGRMHLRFGQRAHHGGRRRRGPGAGSRARSGLGGNSGPALRPGPPGSVGQRRAPGLRGRLHPAQVALQLGELRRMCVDQVVEKQPGRNLRIARAPRPAAPPAPPANAPPA